MIDIRKLARLYLKEAQATEQPIQQRGLSLEGAADQGLLGLFSVPRLASAIAPVGTYEDGSTHLAWPSLIVDGAEGFSGLWDNAANSREGVYPTFDVEEGKRAAGNSFLAAGLAATGGVAAGAASVPENSLGMFAGRMAKTADQGALAKAEQMASQGVPREQIWRDTGWFKGVDGKWRFEIDDSGAKFDVPASWDDINAKQPISNKFTHPQLFESYPEHPTLTDSPGSSGVYRPSENEIGLGGVLPRSAYNNKKHYDGAVKNQNSVALHELQHWVQGQEDFALGASPDSFVYQNDPMFSFRKSYESPHEAYRRVAGETEARTVQKRMSLTADERRARPPWLDYDVPESDQIVRFGSDGPQMSIADDSNPRTAPLAPGIVNALERNPELPMDTASRLARAREMGFDTDRVLYHGTDSDFEEFQASPIGALGPGVYGGGSEAAGIYSMQRRSGGDPRVIPYMVRGDMASWPELKQAMTPYMDAGMTQGQAIQSAAKDLEAAGKSGIFVSKNNSVVFDPRNIRSVNAAFDPAKADSANLLAANPVTSAPLSLLGQGDDDMDSEEGQRRAIADFVRRRMRGGK